MVSNTESIKDTVGKHLVSIIVWQNRIDVDSDGDWKSNNELTEKKANIKEKAQLRVWRSYLT